MDESRQTTPTTRGKASEKEKRFETLNSFCDIWISKYKLSSAEAIIYLVIYRHGRNGKSYVTVPRIAQCLGWTERRTYRGLEKILKKGLIQRAEDREHRKCFLYACKLDK